MPAPLPPRTEVPGRMLFLAFAAVVGSFLATNLIVQRASNAVGTLSEGIIYNSAPSIEHLALVRKAVLEAELTLSHFIHEPLHRPQLGQSLDKALAHLKKETQDYFNLPPLPGEQAIRLDVQESWARFDSAVRHTRTVAESNGNAEAMAQFNQEIEPMGQRVLEAVTRAIEFDAARGREMAESIRETRYRTMWLANSLNGVCAILAVAVAWLLYREARARRALFDAHTKFLEERAAELEQFAGRVAHDIRNPLSAARMAAELAIRKSPDEAVREPVTRIIRSLSRADAITSALLDFARSGARPDPGARTELRTVIADLLGGFAAEAEQAGITLHSEPVPPVLVACSPGVYLSVLGNLVRNAMKYMGDVPTRRVTIRVLDEGAFIRTEVIDTGQGIAPENLRSLFVPYFRGHGGGAEGLGLGLATVKRLTEGHGGRVGATSERGKGSTFWFELHRAGSSWDAASQDEGAPLSRPPDVHH